MIIVNGVSGGCTTHQQPGIKISKPTFNVQINNNVNNMNNNNNPVNNS